VVQALNAPASTEVRVNQAIPEMDGALRPDLVTVDEVNKTVTIVDVTIPFENGYATFRAGRHEKMRKYAPWRSITTIWGIACSSMPSSWEHLGMGPGQ